MTGPFFTDGMLTVAGAEIVDEVAAQVTADVHLNLDRSIRRPTPYYETQITNELDGDDRVVHDRGIVYGPWLEGTSRRNSTTGFRGYHSFGRAQRSVSVKVQELAEHVLRRYLS